tara:strand:+ start:223 stop:1062 length:840 start_codon:yes stop_codon:yes gene_type:complete
MMTDEQNYLFDLNGYLLIPGVLSAEECRTLREFITTLHSEPESLPEIDRYSLSGPASFLLDHPAIVEILEAIATGENHQLTVEKPGPIAPQDMPGYLQTEDAYPFRCDGSFSVVRPAGKRGLSPHAYPRVGPLFGYQCHNKKIYSGLTRVAWELNEVGPDDEATTFVPGSHKANFPTPGHLLEHGSPIMQSYTCPEGSLIVFTEALTHAGGEWRNPDFSRIAILHAYGPILAQYHKLDLPPEVIEAMPPKRRTLFRGVWGHRIGDPAANVFYDRENQAM